MKNCQGTIPSSDQDHIKLQLIDRQYLKELSEVLDSWSGPDSIKREMMTSGTLGPLEVFSPMLEKNLNPIPLRSLLRIFLGRLGSNLAVLEDPYIEVEFWDTFSYFHSKSFSCKRKQCWRIHFFKWTTSREKQPASLVSGLYQGESQKGLLEKGFDYLGFATIRPTTSFCVGRTAVVFADQPGGRAEIGEDKLEEDGIPFCKGKGGQVANVGATRLEVDSVAFLQQDPIVGMCATASLWIASQVLASKFDLHKYPYIDISRQATQPNLTPFVLRPADDNEDLARGLTAAEICGAMIRTGAIPIVIMPRLFSNPDSGNAHLRDQLYTFVESELPVIICLQNLSKGKGSGHAVTAVGHLQANIKAIPPIEKCAMSVLSPKGSQRQFLVSLSVKRYYVHNDNYGPFDRMDFLEKDDPLLKGFDGKTLIAPVKLSRDDSKIYDVKSLIIPIPPYVKNRPDSILQDAHERFKVLFGQKVFSKEDRGVLWRIMLVKGSRFKQSLVDRQWPKKLIELYAEMHMPKYVWLCEFSIAAISDMKKLMGVSSSRDHSYRMIDGEFIYDTTNAYYDTRAVVQRLGAYFIPDNNLCRLSKEEINKKLLEYRIADDSLFDKVRCFSGPAQA